MIYRARILLCGLWLPTDSTPCSRSMILLSLKYASLPLIFHNSPARSPSPACYNQQCTKGGEMVVGITVRSRSPPVESIVQCIGRSEKCIYPTTQHLIFELKFEEIVGFYYVLKFISLHKCFASF